MIKVVIERYVSETHIEKKSVLIRETPTEQRQARSFGGEEVVMDKQYELAEVPVSNTRKVTLLEQEIEDESRFDLGKVIKSINQLGE